MEQSQPPRKRIHNPVTEKYYAVRERSSKSGSRGQIKGLWTWKPKPDIEEQTKK